MLVNNEKENTTYLDIDGNLVGCTGSSLNTTTDCGSGGFAPYGFSGKFLFSIWLTFKNEENLKFYRHY